MATTTNKPQTVSFTIKQDQLTAGIRSVVHAANHESFRYALGGVRLVIMPGAITFVATDGRRLAWRRIEMDHGIDPIEFTIPLREAKALAKIPAKRNATITIDSDPIKPVVASDAIHKIVVEWTNGKRQSKTTEFEPLRGMFPKWQQVVVDAKREWRGELSGKANELLAHFAEPQGIDIRVNGKVETYRHSQRLRGESIRHDGKFDVCMSPEFLVDVLSACGESKVVFRVHDQTTPVWFQCDNGLCSVIMPRALDN